MEYTQKMAWKVISAHREWVSSQILLHTLAVWLEATFPMSTVINNAVIIQPISSSQSILENLAAY